MSNKKQTVKLWLENILQTTNGIHFNENGHYFIQHDCGTEVRISSYENDPFVYLYGVLCQLHSSSNVLLQRALEHNLFLENTKGATLAIDKANNCLVLNYREEISRLDKTLFENIIINYVDTLNELESLTDSACDTDQNKAPTMQSFLRV
ncbi:type III secretion system chaperone [Pseudomonas sp. HK3]